jgi:hypothetical protein
MYDKQHVPSDALQYAAKRSVHIDTPVPSTLRDRAAVGRAAISVKPVIDH